MAQKYMDTNGILIEPQRLFDLASSNLHHFYTICFF